MTMFEVAGLVAAGTLRAANTGSYSTGMLGIHKNLLHLNNVNPGV